MAELYATGPAILDDGFLDLRPGQDGQIAAMADRPHESFITRMALAVADGELQIADAVLIAVIEVAVAGEALLGRGRDEKVGETVVHDRIGDAEFASAATKRALASLVALTALEQRQDIVPAPAGVSQLPPVLVVQRVAANIEHAVDGARPAQPPPPRPIEPPAVQMRLGLGEIAPVVRTGLEQPRHAGRDLDPTVLGLRTGLQQKHARIGIGGKPVGQDAAGGPGAHDHIVELIQDLSARASRPGEP